MFWIYLVRSFQRKYWKEQGQKIPRDESNKEMFLLSRLISFSLGEKEGEVCLEHVGPQNISACLTVKHKLIPSKPMKQQFR